MCISGRQIAFLVFNLVHWKKSDPISTVESNILKMTLNQGAFINGEVFKANSTAHTDFSGGKFCNDDGI